LHQSPDTSILKIYSNGSIWGVNNDYDDEDDDGNQFRDQREREEEERERAYYESPEGIAERKKISDRKGYFWKAKLMIWVTRPYEMMKYIFNRLFKRTPPSPQSRGKLVPTHFVLKLIQFYANSFFYHHLCFGLGYKITDDIHKPIL
jgi:hypothetical protein